MSDVKRKIRLSSATRKGWTPARRLAQAARLRAARPWLRSTGPKTESGKARSAQNAYKHGNRGIAMRRLRYGMRLQQRCIAMFDANVRIARQSRLSGLPLPMIPSKAIYRIGVLAIVEMARAMAEFDAWPKVVSARLPVCA